jgi:hypothetical protein
VLFPLSILPQTCQYSTSTDGAGVNKIELRELRDQLRDQLKKKWGPDMTELKPPGGGNQDLKVGNLRAIIENPYKTRKAEIGRRGAGVHAQPKG